MVGVNSFAFRSAASPKTRKTNLQENSTVLRKTGPKTRGKFEPRMEPILVQKWTNFGLIFGPKMDQFLVQKWTNFWSKKQQPLFADFFRRKKKATFICRFCQQPLFARFGNLVPRASSTARRQSPSPENPGTLAGERKSNLYLQIFQQPLFAEKKSNLYLHVYKKQPLFADFFPTKIWQKLDQFCGSQEPSSRPAEAGRTTSPGRGRRRSRSASLRCRRERHRRRG